MAKSWRAIKTCGEWLRILILRCCLLCSPFCPTWISCLVLNPIRMIGLSFKRFLACHTSFTLWRSVAADMLVAEIQSTAFIAAIRLSTANVRKTAIDLRITIRMIAIGGHAITNIPLPRFVVSDTPSHCYASSPVISSLIPTEALTPDSRRPNPADKSNHPTSALVHRMGIYVSSPTSLTSMTISTYYQIGELLSGRVSTRRHRYEPRETSRQARTRNLVGAWPREF